VIGCAQGRSIELKYETYHIDDRKSCHKKLSYLHFGRKGSGLAQVCAQKR
jgi:hypothetical protein